MALGQHYDAMVVDASFADDHLRVGVEDVADVLVAVTLPSLPSAEAATHLLKGSWVRLPSMSTAIDAALS